MVAVEQVVEAKEQEESCIGASTHDEVHSTEVVAKHENEMNEQQVEYGIKIDMTKEGVSTRKDEHGDPKKLCEWIDWGCNKSGMSLTFRAGKVQVHVASFGS